MKINKKLILASGSPRRRQILSDAGFVFEVAVRSIDERNIPEMNLEKIPEYLSRKKVNQFVDLDDSNIIIASDTVVMVDGRVLNKPKDKIEAAEMLKVLSGKTHTVITGVTIKIGQQVETFSDKTDVRFKTLTDSEIRYYIDNYSPLDKAGSYGIQDFIGMVGIDRLEGSFYTVMGLPVHLIYDYLKPYIQF